MNTTGEVGRNVPVPARCMTNGSCAAAAVGQVRLDVVQRSAATGVGGSSVTCGQTRSAAGSPTSRRQFASDGGVRLRDRDRDAQHHLRRTFAHVLVRRGRKPTRSYASRDGRRRRTARARSAPAREDAVELGRIGEQLRVRLANGSANATTASATATFNVP